MKFLCIRDSSVSTDHVWSTVYAHLAIQAARASTTEDTTAATTATELTTMLRTYNHTQQNPDSSKM